MTAGDIHSAGNQRLNGQQERMPLNTLHYQQLTTMQTLAPDEPRVRSGFDVRAEKLE